MKLKSKNNPIPQDVEQSSDISSSSDVLIVKLPRSAKKATRKRINRANAQHRRTIESLTNQNDQLNRKINTVRRKYYRLANTVRKANENTSSTTSSDNTHSTSTHNESSTPRKRTLTEIREEGLTPSKIPKKIQERLLFANVLSQELGIAWKSNGVKGKSVLRNFVNGNINRKYKMQKMLGLKSGIRRQNFKARNCSKKLTSLPKIRRGVETRERSDVINFL